eukprot:Lithocolla_globosa_v1_NODE_354_length_4343_cov_21.892024.p4 type:complete len:159 gc:universal NODE_354_length_4343_cov_21.892024:1094-1570(+)
MSRWAMKDKNFHRYEKRGLIEDHLHILYNDRYHLHMLGNHYKKYMKFHQDTTLHHSYNKLKMSTDKWYTQCHNSHKYWKRYLHNTRQDTPIHIDYQLDNIGQHRLYIHSHLNHNQHKCRYIQDRYHSIEKNHLDKKSKGYLPQNKISKWQSIHPPHAS